MIRECVEGVVFYRFRRWANGSDREYYVKHAVLTRIGGVSQAPYATLNLGHTVGDDLSAVEENHRRALGVMGIAPGEVVSPYQVHGARVGIVGPVHAGTVQPATDALVTATPGLPILMRFGDCTPVLFFDPQQGVVGMAHAGWRGIVAGVVPATVHTLVERLGCDPADVQVGIGPTIGPCCYQVGEEVVEAVRNACPPASTDRERGGPDEIAHQGPDGRWYLDLAGAVRRQLYAVGIPALHIEEAGLCTACRVDEFFSHRAERGRTGRFGILIGLT